jgi:hypothetical protein
MRELTGVVSCIGSGCIVVLPPRKPYRLSMFAGYEVIALGDLNDFSLDPPDSASSKPISMVLQILTGTLPPDVGRSITGLSSTPRLYNVMEKMPRASSHATRTVHVFTFLHTSSFESSSQDCVPSDTATQST